VITVENMTLIRDTVLFYKNLGCTVLGEAMVHAEGTDYEPYTSALSLFFPIDFPLDMIGPELGSLNLQEHLGG
jgi:hypothetical protein